MGESSSTPPRVNHNSLLELEISNLQVIILLSTSYHLSVYFTIAHLSFYTTSALSTLKMSVLVQVALAVSLLSFQCGALQENQGHFHAQQAQAHNPTYTQLSYQYHPARNPRHNPFEGIFNGDQLEEFRGDFLVKLFEWFALIVLRFLGL